MALHDFSPMVYVLPRLITPGVVSPPAVLEFILIFEFASIVFVMPAEGTLRVNVPFVPPPESPLPVAVVMPMIVPAPGNVCPETNVTLPV